VFSGWYGRPVWNGAKIRRFQELRAGKSVIPDEEQVKPPTFAALLPLCLSKSRVLTANVAALAPRVVAHAPRLLPESNLPESSISLRSVSGVYGFVRDEVPGVSLRCTPRFNSAAPFGRWGAKVRLRRYVRIVLGDHDPPGLHVSEFLLRRALS